MTERRKWWLAGALLAELAFTAVDIATADALRAHALYLLPVLALAIVAPPADVALVAGVALVVSLLSPIWSGGPDDDFAVPVVTTVAGSAIALLAARRRELAAATRAAAEAERRRLHMLSEAARITDGAGEIEGALGRLVDLLVPDVADAAWIDVLRPEGGIRRLAARVDGPDAEELERWLIARGGPIRAELSPTSRVLRGEGSQLAELTPELREAMTHDDEDRRLMELSGLRWTIVLPLVPSGGPLGALGLGVGHSGRRYGPAELAFARLLVGRAGLALANAQLVGRLTATQRRLDGILGALAEAVTVHDGHGRLTYANDAAAALLGLRDVQAVTTSSPADLIARFDVRDADGRPVGLDDLPGARVIRGELPEPMLTQSVLRTTGRRRWLLTKATPLQAEAGELLAVNVIEDVTEEHEAGLRERLLSEAGEALSSSLDFEDTLQRVAQLAVPRLADWCAIELPDDRGELQQLALAHVDPTRVAQARSLRERYPPDPDAPAGSHVVMRTGEPQLVAEVSDAMLVAAARDAEHLDALRALGLSSAMTVPMITGGRTLGVMTFVLSESGRRYAEHDLAFAQELAARAATAIENARLYTERSLVAQTLQASLLPDQLPEVPGWRFAAEYRPGQRGTEVGGDFYDVFEAGDGQIVLLGDVTGKGVAAAALTSLVRHTAKTAAVFDARPAAVLDVVNGALRKRPLLAPVTMLCGALRGSTVTLAVGGHPLPLLRRGAGPCEKVGIPGLLLGAVPDYPKAQELTLVLAPGDSLLLYTDGVTDTPGPAGRFGEERLRAAVDAAPQEPTALLAAVSAALDAYASGGALDDRAMLVLHAE